jgi:hypothetical protein
VAVEGPVIVTVIAALAAVTLAGAAVLARVADNLGQRVTLVW